MQDRTRFRIPIAKLLTFIVALQVLNLSIFRQDFDPLQTHRQSIGKINAINSIVEYVAEIVLDNENALPEYQQENTERKDLQAHKHMPVKLITFNELVTALPSIGFKQSFHYPLNDSRTAVLNTIITMKRLNLVWVLPALLLCKVLNLDWPKSS